MIRKIAFFRRFHSKCDCCKRVTSISHKLQIEEDNTILGELNLCESCYTELQKYIADNKVKKNNSEDNGAIIIEDDEEIDFSQFEVKSLI